MRSVHIKIITLVFFSVLLFGCASTRQNALPNSTEITITTKQYLQKAAQSQGVEEQKYKMLAVNQLLADKNLNYARQLLSQFNYVELDPSVYSQKMILEAKLALLNNKPRLAIKQLHTISNPMSLPGDVAIIYYKVAAEAHLRNNDLAYNIIALISLNSLIDDQYVQQHNALIIWHKLQSLSLTNLQNLLKRCNSPLLRGWIQLAILAEENANNPVGLFSSIQKWQQVYPNHQANSILPSGDNLANLLQVHVPTQIALLLPLHGNYAKMGQAVRDGYLTAFYTNTKRIAQVPPTVKIYDTSENDVSVLYKQAVREGAQFIIGPLTRENVKKLVNFADIEVPTLALNYLLDSKTSPENLIQFGLLPEWSAQQAADSIWSHGSDKILIIVPRGEWGDKVKQSFLVRWEQFSGYLAGTISFTTKENIAADIVSALNIDQSKLRAETLQNVLGKKVKFIARRRQDINGIFLVATPKQARQIRPLLQFYYAGDIPIFAISNVYAGHVSSRADRDLNNINFNDMPWLLKKTNYINKLKGQIKTLWGANFRSNSRLYGLGVDSYTLSVLLSRMRILPDFAVNGVTGHLYLNKQQQVYRQLLWAKFVSGVPRLETP